MAQINITVLHLVFLASCLLLQFCFVFFRCWFLSTVGSTPESQVVRGRVGSVAHPAEHRMTTIRQSELLYSSSVDSRFLLNTCLVVIRALWLADPSTVSIQEAPRSTYVGWLPGKGVDVHSHVFPIMSYSPAGRNRHSTQKKTVSQSPHQRHYVKLLVL